MESFHGRGGPDPHVPTGENMQAIGWRARPDSEGQPRTVGGIPDKEIGLVTSHIPGLRSEAARAVLLQADRRCVPIGDMQLKSWRRGAQADPSDVVNIQGMCWGPGLDRERGTAGRDVLDRELVQTAI